MFGAMQMYQMQAMEQHIAQKENRRRESVSRLVRLRDFLRQDLASLGEQIDTTLDAVCSGPGLPTTRIRRS
ncbi:MULTISPECIES: hypothetical protein [Asaia]|uniref:hypothetical protein n=1 Tax=Asaia TaxID=91914 RepID=UPI000EFA4E1C|nr:MULTISPECIES: hypothetical protein [Asaia]NIE79272.1 hypothetical protein [Asaia sp. As-1742]